MILSPLFFSLFLGFEPGTTYVLGNKNKAPQRKLMYGFPIVSSEGLGMEDLMLGIQRLGIDV